MSSIVVQTFLTLDGIMQAPGAPEEDRSGGFAHGGWQAPHFDETTGEIVGAWFQRAEGLLLGRRTYDIFAAYWPNVPADHNQAAMAEVLNALPKYVASRTLTEVTWQNTTLLGDDVPAAVAKLRERDGGTILVSGSGDLVQTLIRHDLVDEFQLLTFPVLLGTGRRLFGEGTVPAGLRLVESRTTPSGAVSTVYRPAGEVRYGSFD